MRSVNTLIATLLIASHTAVTAPLQQLSERAQSKGYDGIGIYTITSVATGTRINLRNGRPDPYTPVNGWHASSGPDMNNQQWAIVEVDEGFVTFTNVNSGTVIHADPTVKPSDNPNDRWNRLTGVVLPPSPWTGAAHWKLEPADTPNAYIIRSRYFPSAVMDLKNSESADGTPLLAWPIHRGLNQQWILEKL